ncbi:MAG: GtrA family protein [Clostridiales bacterium]|nr:GtrA family protein [Clostridiales bacterium]
MEENKVQLSKKDNIIQALKFTMFSISAGVIQIVVDTLLNELPPRLFDVTLSYWACYLPALIASVVYNFTINRKFTFKSANNVPIAMLKVACYYVVFTPVSTILGNMAAEHFNAAEHNYVNYIILGITMIINFATEFLVDRFIVFRNSINTNDIAKKEQEAKAQAESEKADNDTN